MGKLKLSLLLAIITLLIIFINNNQGRLESTEKINTIEEILEKELIIEENETTTDKNINVQLKGYYVTTTYTQNDKVITQDYIEYNNRLTPFYKEQLTKNYNRGLIINPKYLVIHETANTSVGADAFAHYRYWSRDDNAQASTHFVVDSEKIYQMLELNQSAWHVGDNKGHSDITNVNSIGIEVAVNQDGDFTKARQNAIDLTINIMRELKMDISQLKRHYDASGKYCPTNMLQNPVLWDDFVKQVEKGLKNN
ncbi:MAG TPA: N-acetylmuramoyl-L-alanine amidase [Haloplasmataceae bacterium]